VAVEDFRRLRREYERDGLDESHADPDPYLMFSRWLSEAIEARLYEPNAMVLSTVSTDGAPSSRVVLLKGLDRNGLVFFTNLTSAKADDLAHRPRCALLFPWQEMERQVRVAGEAVPLDDEENDIYFASRPRTAQLGAWASPQSRPVASRADLESSLAEVERRFADRPVGRPPFWGGYRVVPDTVEFWQGRPGRLHDRLRYRREDGTWRLERLAP
jgi:pyridoxamine 5'-phosphate oxidase